MVAKYLPNYTYSDGFADGEAIHHDCELYLNGIDLGSRRASRSESNDLVGLDYIGTHTLREFRIKLGGIPCD